VPIVLNGLLNNSKQIEQVKLNLSDFGVSTETLSIVERGRILPIRSLDDPEIAIAATIPIIAKSYGQGTEMQPEVVLEISRAILSEFKNIGIGEISLAFRKYYKGDFGITVKADAYYGQVTAAQFMRILGVYTRWRSNLAYELGRADREKQELEKHNEKLLGEIKSSLAWLINYITSITDVDSIDVTVFYSCREFGMFDLLEDYDQFKIMNISEHQVNIKNQQRIQQMINSGANQTILNKTTKDLVISFKTDSQLLARKIAVNELFLNQDWIHKIDEDFTNRIYNGSKK